MQNAAIIMSRKQESIMFDVFELSPQNRASMNTKGRLQRCFPASSVSIHIKIFDEEGCQSALAHTIAKMSHQEAAEMKPKVMKAGEEHIEERDTTHPRLVTDLLVTILSALGKTVQAPSIWKNTREEVLWRDAKLPWRRSPLWLLARVALQILFSRLSPNQTLYKEFMIFLMAHILKAAQTHDLPSDLLYCVTAKISRRLLKLDRDRKYPWLQRVEEVLLRTRLYINRRWKEVMRQSDPSLKIQSLSGLQFEQDTYALYPKLDEFIRQISSRRNIENKVTFDPPYIAIRFDQVSLPSIQVTSTDESTFFGLLAFENWVVFSLGCWLDSHVAEKEACGELFSVMRSYHQVASQHYSENPESLSIMLLTILEMWVACDKLACRHSSLLSDYDPEIPYQLLQSLNLPFKDQMERLGQVETHVKARRDQSNPGSPSIFSSFGHPDSFSVRYFAKSLHHQDLLRQIERDANLEREKKKDEFRRLKAEYTRLQRLYSQSDCSYYETVDLWTGNPTRVHSESCQKCGYLRSAESLAIEVHEWPLPTNKLKAQSTIFELQAPKFFSDWRNATTYVVNDVLKSTYDGGNRFEWTLQRYLPSFYKTGPCRLILVSTTKPNRGTHRYIKAIYTATEHDILVRNGMTYQYYDNAVGCFVSDIKITDKIPLMCTYQLSQHCAKLQNFIFRPFLKPNGLLPNDVISQQAYCPDHLSLEEFKAMATLPIGYRIQWLNILTNLHVPAVDFKKIDTVLTLLQISRQAGPPLGESAYRASHQLLRDEVFVETFLHGLSLALDRIKENWESCHALGCFISLATRLLTFAPSSATSSGCLVFLERCRAVALKWIYLLQDKTRRSGRDEERMEFLVRTFQVAHICVGSFDIDEHDLRELLAKPSEAGVLIESSVVIQTTMYSALRPQDVFHRNATQRWRRLLYRSYHILFQEIVKRRNPCLDLAIRKSWSAFLGGETWEPVSTSVDHWLTTRTTSSEGTSSLVVHFNLLTAELLVNGLPLSRLPAEYERHPSYETLFGRTTLEVMPANVPGMQFSSKKTHHEYTVFFGLSDSNELLLVATKNGQTLDLIPSKVFNNLLPDHFIQDYTHWYDRNSRTIEFRLKSDPWVSSSTHWAMENAGSSWVLRRGWQSLVGLKSSTAKHLFQLLKSLESEAHIHTIFNPDSGGVDMEMPRLQLGFSLQFGSAKLYSRQFRGLYVDPVQSIGTLVGLESKLVLRDEQNHRKVLLPNGYVRWVASEGHIKASIQYGSSNRVHPYDVDTMLGRLVDNGSLQSKMFLCYLHAITSYCLPDELTGKTGTEESLSILNSAAVRSFGCLSRENLDILDNIAKLSPKRAYYPAHERVMESIAWDNDLSFLSQHGGFYTSVKSILHQASSSRFFYPDLYIEPRELGHVDNQLGIRQSIRDSIFQVCGFGAENHTSDYDELYKGRDQLEHSERSFRAYEISTMIFEQRRTLHREISANFEDEIWALFKDDEDTQGPSNFLSAEVIGYDAEWLGDTKPLLRKYWCRLHSGLGNTPSRFNKFWTMLCLTTMAYSRNGNSQVMQALAAFANIPSVGRIDVPNARCFQISKGRTVKASCIKNTTCQHLVPFSECPESNLTRNSGETNPQLQHRRHNTFQINKARVIQRFVDSIQNQWVCEVPQTPSGSDFPTYIQALAAMEEVRSKWREWYQNYRFYEYLEKIAMALRRCVVRPIDTPKREAKVEPALHTRARSFINEQDLFQHSIPSLPQARETTPDPCHLITAEGTEGEKLAALVERLGEQASRKHERNYVQELQRSARSLKSRNSLRSMTHHGESLREVLRQNLFRCRDDVNAIYHSLETAVGFNGKSAMITSAATHSFSTQVAARFMAPRVSSTFFLRQLARKQWRLLSQKWKEAVVAYGLALTNLQRAERMLKVCNNEADFLKELLNPGHINWEPLDYPESLLLEVESSIMIRDVQEEIASRMREPPNNTNAVMQLNMGEGKSSVIVPIVAAHLADGSKLVRVIVAKPQAKELFRALVSKLGGLLDHRIYHMPFSRSLKLTTPDAHGVDRLYKECMEKGGVLLMQPEHMLSFKLMGIECRESGKEEVSRILLGTQHSFNLLSRDIVDESDENFSVKFELIYTMGTQKPIELSPERWTLIQRFLSIVALVAPTVQEQLPGSIEVTHCSQGHFPRTRILREDAQKLLLSKVAQKICDTGLLGFPIARQPDEVRKSVLNYISDAHLSFDQIASVEGNSTFFTESTKGPLFLLRGLVAEGVLGFTLGLKRWRVNYGLDSSRRPNTRLAVPYRAKDSPTARSEFSHPDVVVVLTCLSYYYGGLLDDDLFLAFDHLIKSDQADIEYHEWVKNAPNLPTSFHRLIGVNMKDRFQAINQIFPHLRFTKSVIDYFLAHIVFPKEMKEFPQKLSASGWDIGQRKVHPTTGFSGTIDSHHLLPLDIEYLDLEEQRHTNALVLEHLLQPENTVDYLSRPKGRNCSDAETLLSLVTSMERPIQVILDVGAQILELNNVQVARKWLEMLPTEQGQEAVVFFNAYDDLCVVDRKGHVEPLQTSPYSEQLDVCLVFLDEAHTRGTDLKLPEYYRAAVTLGANLTKDRLVQGKRISHSTLILTDMLQLV